MTTASSLDGVAASGRVAPKSPSAKRASSSRSGELSRDVRAHAVGRLRDLAEQLLAAVDKRDDVAQVAAA